MKDSTQGMLNAFIERLPELAAIKEDIIAATDMLAACYYSGGKIMVCGNGGSAADSEHIVGELMKSFAIPRPIPDGDIGKLKSSGAEDWERLAGMLQAGIPSLSLEGHLSLSTAVLNDTDPYMTYAQQVYVCGKQGDVLIGLSTSGGAKNVLNAIKVARAFGVHTIGFTGQRRSPMDDLCELVIKAPSVETYRVQEYHQPIYHTICLMLENEIFGVQ